MPFLILAFFILSSCVKGEEESTYRPCEPNFRTSCTPLFLLDGPSPDLKFIGDAYLEQLTDYLARQKQIESRSIGFSGTLSEVYQAYLLLKKKASLEQLKLLLSHYSPIVRYYSFMALCERDATHKKYYYQLLEGKYQKVSMLDGCVGFESELRFMIPNGFFEP
jgi:hypothetical protein